MPYEELTADELALCQRFDFKDRVTVGVVFAAAGLLLLSGAILVWHAYQWLLHGFWPNNTWADGFDFMGLAYPRTEAVGAQRIIDWFMSWGLWTLPLLVAILGSWAWIVYADYSTPETKAALQKRASLRAYKLRQARDNA